MKKYKLLIALLFFTPFVFSQTGFYISPTLEYKFDTNKNTSYSLTTTQGSNIDVKALNFTPEHVVFLGLRIGWQWRNNFLEIGYGQDRSSLGIKISANCYDTEKQNYYTKFITGYQSLHYNKIPIRAGYRLWGADTIAENKKFRWQGFLFGGLDLFIANSLSPTNGNTNGEFVTDPLGDAVKYSSIIYAPVFSIYTVRKTFGFMLKMHTKHGREINYSIYYTLNHITALVSPSSNYYTRSALTFTNYNGSVESDLMQANGTGVYITLSTNLYSKNWSKKKVKNFVF